MKNYTLFFILFLFTSFIFSSNHTLAEGKTCPAKAGTASNLNKKLSLDFKDTNISNAFTILQKALSPYNVISINIPNHQITINVRDKSIQEILDQISNEYKLFYNIRGNVIAFYKKDDPARFKTTKHKKYMGKCISLDLQETNLSSVIKIIEGISKKKVKNFPSAKLNEKVTLRVIDIPWQQAFDQALLHLGLESNVTGEIIEVN